MLRAQPREQVAHFLFARLIASCRGVTKIDAELPDGTFGAGAFSNKRLTVDRKDHQTIPSGGSSHEETLEELLESSIC